MGRHVDATAPFEPVRVVHEDMFFTSQGLRCAATLYTPAGQITDVPCIVMAPGISLTRRDGLPRFAEHFASAGFAVLTFDYRFFGDSEGEPRQLLDFHCQRDDLDAAIAFARTLSPVDPARIALWGFSLGGGHVIRAAAADASIVAVVAMAPFVDGLALTRAMSLRSNLRILSAAGGALLARRPFSVLLYGVPSELVLFRRTEAESGFEALHAEDSTWHNQLLLQATQLPAVYRPIRDAADLTQPLLVAVGIEDTMMPIEPIRTLVNAVSMAQLEEYPGGHFAGFLASFEDATETQLAFLTRYLMDYSVDGTSSAT